jgi:peptidoglycan/xylan/chitin deacetylase (PgdA/CDA1 family)
MSITDRCNSIFAISLDFELFWGVRDSTTLSNYGHNILGVQRAIPKLLELFAKYDIHSTWATVGFLFFTSKKELLANLPDLLPTYQNPRLNPYDRFDKIGESDRVDPYHYAPALIQQIDNYPQAEIASHTFSHYDCNDAGQTTAQFAADLMAAIDIAGRYGIEINSLVLPGDRLPPEYVDVCRQAGIRAYRSAHHRSIHLSAPRNWRRMWYFLDSYIPLSGRNVYPLDRLNGDRPIEIPASRYLKPYTPNFDWLESLRQRRILRSMTAAAKSGGLYHLCWRPHDFGTHLERNLKFLERILRHYTKLEQRYGMSSLNMGEIADLSQHRQPVVFPVVERQHLADY